MVDVRCQCGKILCQHDTEVVIIKCRHCKRIINITIKQASKQHRSSQVLGSKYVLTQPSMVNI